MLSLLLLVTRAKLGYHFLSTFPELVMATTAAVVAQSMRLPQRVKRSISRRVLCFG